jgi:hypothetical protein
MFAKGEHQFCGLDKLGVTGSSPVPPTFGRYANRRRDDRIQS